MKLQTPKGFKDYYGSELRLRRKIINTLIEIFESYGYEPLETPSIEYAETILGKYGKEAEKLIYRFKDAGERDLALIYEMTTSACRYVAQNYQNLSLPFKRYQIQKAWRAEKPQRGRLREFTQCDADVWGEKSVSVDAEFIDMSIKAMTELGFKDFVVKISSRKILSAIAYACKIPENKFYDFTVSIDKLDKFGREKVHNMLLSKKIEKESAQKALQILSGSSTLDDLKNAIGSSPEGLEGIIELEEIFAILNKSKVNENYYIFSPSIVRGLSYYTGPIWEVEVKEGKNVGSVAGAGRFDNLTKTLSGADIPASGGSFGVDRLAQIISERKEVSVPRSISKALVTVFSPELANTSRELAKALRDKNINTELYLDSTAKLKKQLKYASNKGIPHVVVIGPDEQKQNKAVLKNMETGKQETLDIKSLIKTLS